MSMYKKTATLFFLLFSPITQLDAKIQSTSSDQLDPMVVFAYPISVIESVRQDLSRALYFLQQHDVEEVPALLQDALTKLASRKVINDDDRDHMQNLIDQITALIEVLENKEKSAGILDLCQELQDKL